MESKLIRKWTSNFKVQSQLGIFRILKDSFKIIKTNGKLLLPVLVLVFVLFSQLEFAENYLLEAVAKDLSIKLEENPKVFQDLGNNMNQSDYRAAMKDIRDTFLVKFFAFIFSSIISLVFLVAVVSSSSEAYTAKVLDLKEMILKIKKSWKRPILTSFYMILIPMGSIFVCIFSIAIVSIFALDSWTYLFYGVLGLLILVFGSYFIALWMMSLVVSVLENVGGLDAIVRARELMKGKKVQASLIMVLFTVAYEIVYLMTYAVTSFNVAKWSRLPVSIPFSNGLLCALKLLAFVVFAVFYHERKESCYKLYCGEMVTTYAVTSFNVAKRCLFSYCCW